MRCTRGSFLSVFVLNIFKIFRFLVLNTVEVSELILSISSNCVLTVINASAAVTLLEQRPEKIQALSGIRTHDLCDGSAVLS